MIKYLITTPTYGSDNSHQLIKLFIYYNLIISTIPNNQSVSVKKKNKLKKQPLSGFFTWRVKITHDCLKNTKVGEGLRMQLKYRLIL